jgi:integrase
MSVFKDKRRNGRWSYDFWLGGKRYQGYCVDSKGAPAANRREALDCEAGVRTAARNKAAQQSRSSRQGEFTLNQACVVYLARKKDTEPTNYENHIMYVREIRAFLDGHRAIAEISTDDIERYRQYCASQTIKVWTGGQKKKDDPHAERYWKDTGRARSKRQVNNYLKCLRGLFAVAAKIMDKASGMPVLRDIPDIKLHKVPKRLPRPITDTELDDRLAHAPQWTREAAELSRLFGLRRGEALMLERRHIDHEIQGIRFPPNETKSGNEELAHGGASGWDLLLQLDAQARERGQRHLVMWPGKKYFRHYLAGKPVPGHCWQPLQSIRRSWHGSARRAGIEGAHRFHDVRARYITEVAKILPAAAQDAARHQDASTTAMYIKLATHEVRDAVACAIARRPKLRSVK